MHRLLPARLQDFAEAASDWFWEQDKRLRFTYVSAHFRAVTGIEPHELLGKTQGDMLHASGACEEDVWRAHLTTLEANKPFRDFTYTYLRPDGELRVLRTSGRPIFDRRHRFAGYRGVGRDVTAQANLEKRMGMNHALLEEAIESLPDAFALFDADDRLVLCNGKYRQYFFSRDPSAVELGAKFAQLTERAAGQALLAGGPGERGCSVESWQQQRRPGEFRRQYQWLEGRFFLSSAHRLPGGGIVGVYSDITERHRAEQALRESEERFRNLVEGSVEGILIHGGGKPLFANHAFARIFGYASPDEVLALESAATLVAPYERRRLRRSLAALQRGIAVPNSYHFDGMDRQGAILALKHMVRLVTWEGQPAIQSTVIDVTERRRAEERARQRQAELAHVARLNMMGEMATTLAHELNQPLGAVATYTEACRLILRSGPEDTAQLVRALDQIARQAQRASEIVRRVREFVRKTDQGRTKIDLNGLVRDAVALTAEDAREHGIAIELLLTRDLPLIVADRVQIEQVLLNLLRNSVEAMSTARAGGRRLTVSTAREAAERVVVTVQDNGPGLRAGAERRIFEPFYTTKSDGMGMGLSISRSIVEEHAGRLWVERDRGLGVTFHFDLPACGHHP
jgi:PAS domain S-box-containing protein